MVNGYVHNAGGNVRRFQMQRACEWRAAILRTACVLHHDKARIVGFSQNALGGLQDEAYMRFIRLRWQAEHDATTASRSATQPPVIAAQRVPPSA